MNVDSRFPKNSYACNTELLVFRRRRKNWTQAELAKAAGYTERLISKAESGKPISVATIMDIAEALSFPENPLYAEDLICDPLTLAQNFIEMFLAGSETDTRRDPQMLDSDVCLCVSGNLAEVLPNSNFHGLQNTLKALELIRTSLKNHKSSTRDKQFFVQGNEIMVWDEIGYFLEHDRQGSMVCLCHRLYFFRAKLRKIECRICR